MIRKTISEEWCGYFIERVCGQTYYSLGSEYGRQCSGYARGYMTGHYKDTNDYDAIAWGYEGAGPLLCASSILYGTLVGKYDNSSWPHKNIGGKFTEECMFSKKQIELVHKFHTQVVAHLPDSWTMDGHEVRSWIKDGTLPLCITNKPKEENVK